jgi:hypothetical protein
MSLTRDAGLATTCCLSRWTARSVTCTQKSGVFRPKVNEESFFILFILQNSHHMTSGCLYPQNGKGKIKYSRRGTTWKQVDRSPGGSSLKPLQSVFYEWKVRLECLVTHSGEYSIHSHRLKGNCDAKVKVSVLELCNLKPLQSISMADSIRELSGSSQAKRYQGRFSSKR